MRVYVISNENENKIILTTNLSVVSMATTEELRIQTWDTDKNDNCLLTLSVGSVGIEDKI